MVLARVRHSGKTKVIDFQVTVGVEEDVGWLEVSVQSIGRLDVLQTSQDLVEEVSDVV